jgi:uncharacterized Ntn-hydrolase superfamily protein
MQLNTFSIVAYAPEEQAWGVAVASKFLAAGAVVSWARAGAGAVATQAFARVGFGPEGLALMAQGKPAQETLQALLASDPKRDQRQVGLVDAHGGAAAFTGAGCSEWAGYLIGAGFTCQGNILTGPETLDAMSDAFQHAGGELADRLVAALLAGDTVGGDRRGKQSAAVLVVRPGGGYGGDNDRYLDLRVDDHSQPVRRLEELLALHHLFFGKPRPEDRFPIDAGLARELQSLLPREGYFAGEVSGVWDQPTRQAFWDLVGNENLEERWAIDAYPAEIDQVTLDYLRGRFKLD